MTQEDKELLLKDLCARLPYGVIIHQDDYFDKNYPRPNEVLTTHNLSYYEKELERWNTKPYLRPMSSMTEEEHTYWDYVSSDSGWGITEGLISECVDWLLENHFDYRYLIPKGLAIEAPEGMYNKKGE